MVRPDLREKIIEFKLKAKDVLAAAFLPQQVQNSTYSAVLSNLNENQKLMLGEIQRIESRIESVSETATHNVISLAYELDEIRKEAMPKVNAFNTFIKANGNLSLNKVAKSLNIGRNTMMKILRDKKILFREGGDNIPYQRFVDAGYFTVKHSLRCDGVVHSTTQATAKGVDYIRKALMQAECVR